MNSFDQKYGNSPLKVSNIARHPSRYIDNMKAWFNLFIKFNII
jgi:hypothetical protein